VSSHGGPPRGGLRATSVVGALGVVYGDIGTSPLYALDTSLRAASEGRPPDMATVLGVLSLVFWSIFLLVTLKYVILMLRADNQGEGGVLSLFALVQRHLPRAGSWRGRLVALAVFGAALYYCDALITPAISVMSAVEGLTLLNPDTEHAVVPITLVVLLGLFAIQHRGTQRVGALFGPVMVVWFVTLAVLGARELLNNPVVLQAVNPAWGIALLSHHPVVALAILGGVFLTLTGGEALYADMGHFGRAPVRIAWFGMVWPALLLNYFGQGAYWLSHPEATGQALFKLVPEPLLPAMVVLATVATVIASQAVITSAFSITRQAAQLDFLPRVRVLQTSAAAQGQIYVPVVNRVLWVFVSLFVIVFGSSAALANAYGAAVAGTMIVTTTLACFLAATEWQWPKWRLALVFGPLLCVDLVFIVANLSKFAQGAWLPIVLSTVLFLLFMAWRGGRESLRSALLAQAMPLSKLSTLLAGVHRVPGTGVFLASASGSIPTALVRNLEHNHVAHERILILNMEIMRTPRQDPADRVLIEPLCTDAWLLRARFGYMETPDVSEVLRQIRGRGLPTFIEDCSFFVGWHLVKPRPRSGYLGLRNRVFAWLQRRSAQASEFFRMPERRVIMLVTQVEI
jgi:KUP system potassium uptake protein